MKATELRIGNWVYNPVQEIDFQVAIRTISDTVYDEEIQLPLSQRYQPVPLTKEWLVKFGFRNGGEDRDIHIQLFPNNDSYRLWGFAWNIQHWNILGWEDINAPSIKYVHQLQNLYFALTNKELEIKK
jgi:hypothetical protein|tara:strand:+ start:484 stop:867 length:384 start_codon:yes stop_codon:yes gene_type:complete